MTKIDVCAGLSVEDVLGLHVDEQLNGFCCNDAMVVAAVAAASTISI